MNKKLLYWSWFIVFVCHCNDVKVSVIKISEILLLVYGLLHFPHFHKIPKMLFSLFTLFLAVSLFHNLFLSFDTSVVLSVLQKPYWCSIGRYIEFFCCVTFIDIIIGVLSKYGLSASINVILKVNERFCLLILGLYILEYFHVFESADVITESGRLSGFFNEGGPFGLMISLFIVLSYVFKRSFMEFAVLVLCLLLSFSKAGLLLLMLTILFCMYRRFQGSKRFKVVMSLLLVMALMMVGYGAYLLAYQYSASWMDADAALFYATENPDDYNFTAGRVSGMYIGTEMVKKNFLIGIGLGNYPILRNMTEYRGFFPPIPVYDSMSLGGVADLLVQQGILGVILFAWFLKFCYTRSERGVFILLFVAVLMCGVQMTFVYPWILIALNEYIFKIKKLVFLKLNY